MLVVVVLFFLHVFLRLKSITFEDFSPFLLCKRYGNITNFLVLFFSDRRRLGPEGFKVYQFTEAKSDSGRKLLHF